MKKILMIWILLLSPLVSGLGVAPGETTLDYKEGSDTLSLLLFNSERSVVSLHSDSSFVKVPSSVVVDGQETVELKVLMSGSMKPGPNTARVSIRESSRSDATINALISVVSKITVFVPYPGRYVDAYLKMQEFAPGEESDFIIEAKSRGTETLEKVSSSLVVSDGDSTITKLFSGSETLPSMESVFFTLPATIEKPGEYLAKATVDYDGKTASVEREFVVGKQELEFVELVIESFDRETAVLSVVAFNNWNKELFNVFAELEFVGGSFSSSPTPIERFGDYEKKKLRAVWDLKGSLGAYIVRVTLNYNGEKSVFEIPVTVTKDSILLGEQAEEDLTVQRITSIILLIIVILLLYLYRRKNNGFSPEKKDFSESFL